MIISIPAARAIAFYDFKGKSLVKVLILLPLIVPMIGVAMGIHISFIKLGLANTYLGVLFIHVIPGIPYGVKILTNVFELNGNKIEIQGRVLGANAFQTLLYSANQVTIIALFVGVVPSVFLMVGFSNILAVIILWLSGFLDAVDGTIARKAKTSSPFGTIMDITFDRIVEISLMIALAYRFSNQPFVFVLLASSIILSMTIFLTVGAVSEKASAKSFYYQPGLAERTEGFIMFSLMMIFTKYIDYICVAFTLMILYTAIQRFIEAYKYFRQI